MDFFAQQAKVRRSSHVLVLLFVLAVIAVTVAVDLVVLLAFGLGRQGSQGLPVNVASLAMLSVGVLVLIGLASMYRVASLHGGGSTVARGLGATPVPEDTSNPVWRRLRNVIEEVAIASGVPVPEIYVMEQEAGINAFAAGYTPSDAAVCVTQGCLDRLTRDELQGVIAHEFSHVLNGDMRLNIRLMGLLFGILVIGIVGRFMMYSGGRVRSSRNNNNGASLALIGIAVMVVGYIGFFFGRLIQAAVARSRESLADASAVQFTRQTGGIAGALKKIAALAEGSQLAASNKQEVAHMLFGEPGRFSSLFATHPPLPQRIRALGVAYDETEIEQLAKAWQEPQQADDPSAASSSLSGFAPSHPLPASMTPAASALPSSGASFALNAAAVSAQVGQPGADDFSTAGALQQHMPQALREAVREPMQAKAVLLAMAMGQDEQLRDAQLLRIDSGMGSNSAEAAERIAPQLAGLHPMLRLPLAALAFPALRRRPRPELERLLQTLDALVRADERVDLHEYCLVKLLKLQLNDALDPSGGFQPGGKRLHQCSDSYAQLCAIVATHGHADPTGARQAWLLAMREALPSSQAEFATPSDWQSALDQALIRLDRLKPVDKELVVRGLSIAVSEDGVVTVSEAELLRVICAALHCPLPPMLGRLGDPAQNAPTPPADRPA